MGKVYTTLFIIVDVVGEGELMGEGDREDGAELGAAVAGVLLPLLLLLPERERLMVIPDPRRYSVILQQGVL